MNNQSKELEDSMIKKVVGMKQTLRALENGEAIKVFVASDADKKIIEKIVDLAKKKKVQISYIPTMEELGGIVGIKVGAASIALVKN